MAPKTALIGSYLTKMEDPDMDFRYMALNDLTNTIIDDPQLFGPDEGTEAKTVQKVINLVQDKNSEVKNQAVKCLGQLVKIIKEPQMGVVVDNLVNFIGGKDDELRDIAGLALKTVTAELPNEGRLTEKACATLTPKLLSQVQIPSTPPETIIEMLSILSILLSRFPAYLSDISPSPVTTIAPLLDHGRVAVRKRAAVVLAQSLASASPSAFNNLVSKVVQPGLSSSSLDKQRTIVLLLGSIARYAPGQVSTVLPSILPAILTLSEKDDEELREYCLQTIESFVLRCPSEMTPFIPGSITAGTTLIKYDPNYNEDAEDEEMADAEDEDEDEDEDLGEDYSDDEDTSYKVRRSATKLLSAIIATRPDLLVTIYRTVAPVLVTRFSEREESVRLDVWAAYALLLQQTKLYGSTPQSKDPDSPSGLKRKRSDEGMEVEETPISLLKSQIPGFTKTLLRQLQPKSSDASLQVGFSVLRSLLSVAPGSLTTQLPALSSLTATILAKPASSTSSALHTSIISFLDLVFSTHSPPSFASVLPQLTPPLLKSLGEKDPRVAASGFQAFATLLRAVRPIKSAEWIDPLYTQVLARLEKNDTDASVREQSELCLAELWLSAPDLLRSKNGSEWAALRKSGHTEGSVGVVGRVAQEVEFPTSWVDEFVQWTLGVVRRSSRNAKDDALVCLSTLISKYQGALPPDLPSTIVTQLLPYLSINEVSHFTNSLSVISILLRTAPTQAFSISEADVLPIIYKCAVVQLPSTGLLEAIIDFFAGLVRADPPIATRLIPGLKMGLENVSAGGGASPLNTSRCIGGVVRSEMGLAAATVNDFAKALKPGSKATEPRLILSLHVVGEIGRFIDMSLQHEVFDHALALFASKSQDVRAAAAFAVGNIAIGNLHAFLPIIIKQISTGDESKLLALHSLKEVVTHCTSGQLENVAEALWPPLFENPENSQDSTRNIAAASLGRLTTANPSRYLPILQAKSKDQSPAVRATVMASVRYTFADTTQSYDELLAPLIVDFLSLVQDPDLTVRRLSLTALNAAARNKPVLIREHLATLLPYLYAETEQKKELIKIIDMGPWKHRVDDGLEARKTAFETMYTLLDTCLSNLDLHIFLTHVLRGLSDESDEIKVLCHMMLFRLSQVAPTTVSQRLDEVSPELEEAIKGAQVTKDTVKQDLERASELQRSALRAIAALSKLSSPTISPRMERLVESIEKGPLARQFRELE